MIFDVREYIEHTHETSDIPLSPLGPVSWIISVIGTVGNDDWERVIWTASSFREGLLFR